MITINDVVVRIERVAQAIKMDCGGSYGILLNCVEQLKEIEATDTGPEYTRGLLNRFRQMKDLCDVLASKLMVLEEIKHGFGVPPLEAGYWFCFYEDKNRWRITDNSHESIGQWNESITQYFGPIPAGVWEKEPEVKTLLQRYNELDLSGDADAPDYQKVMRSLIKAVEKLQEKQ